MSNYSFKDFEAVLNNVINPAIKKQFELQDSLYDKIRGSGTPINSKGFRIPFYRDPHPWKSDIRLMAQMLEKSHRELPHDWLKCKDCTDMHRRQIEYALHKIQKLKEQGVSS